MPPIKPNRLSPFVRERIVNLKRHGLSLQKIRDQLIEVDNITVSKNAICQFLVRYRQTGSMLDVPKRNAHRPRLLRPEHYQFIDGLIQNDSEMSAQEIVDRLFTRFGLTVSVSSVKRARKTLGWFHAPVQYCQMVRDANKPKRMNYAVRCITTRETFDNAIFTDETSVKIQTSTKYGFRKRGLRTLKKGKPKYPYKVHVWGGISRRGATGLFIFTCNMDSIFYQSILEQKLEPFVQNVFPDGHRFIQDNDPKHVSRSTKQFMADHGINHWPTPPESPDLNPIEMVWAELKYHIRRRVKPRNQQELINGIMDFWRSLTPEKCNRYINHLYKAIPAVVEKNGAATGF